MTDIQFGLMLRAQFPAGDDMQARFAELVEQARLADRLGFASITKGMHYSAAPWWDLQQFPFLSRIMADAPNLRLNFGLVLLSLHKPLDIAEQIASVDVMSGGKVILGVALGYRDVEYLAFGTTQKERVRRFEENLEAIKRLWTEDVVDMKGSHFTLAGASVGTRPVQKPHPPVWIGANADPAIRRAARLGDCWYVNPHNRIDTIVRQVDVYKRALDACGKPFPREFPARREVFVARSRDEAIKRLWTEDVVDMKGSHFTLAGASVGTRPVQKPHPPVWIGANADPAIRRAARLGDCWYVNPHNRIDTIVRQVGVYRRALDECGKPFPTEFPARREVFVARSRDEAIRLCAPHLGAKYRAYQQWGQNQVMPEGDNDLGVEFDELIRDRFLLGSPDEVAGQILRLHRETGINHLIMSVQWPGMAQSLALDELHMLAEEVFPRVRRA